MEESKESIKIDVSGADRELIIRHGRAPEVVNPKQYSVLGAITAPFAYYAGISKKNDQIQNVSVVEVYPVGGNIIFKEYPEHPLSATINGALMDNPQLESFKVNSDKRWTGDELAAQIFANANLFNVPTNKVREFAAKFRNIKAKITKEIEDVKDDAGNIIDNFIQKVSVDDLPKLPVKAPIYIGGEKSEFVVEVGIEASARSVVFYLFSAELSAMQVEIKEECLAEESKKFTDEGICVITVN